jgi:hypothetical protein
LITIDSDVLEKNVADESILALLLQKIDLSREVKGFELRLKFHAKMKEIFLERFEEEILGFLAHDFDLAGDSLVHFFLSFNGFFGI